MRAFTVVAVLCRHFFLFCPGHDDKLSAASRRAGLITGGSTAQVGTT